MGDPINQSFFQRKGKKKKYPFARKLIQLGIVAQRIFKNNTYIETTTEPDRGQLVVKYFHQGTTAFIGMSSNSWICDL